MQFNKLLTIVFLLPLIKTVVGQYFNTTSDEETTTITSKVTMYITMGDETYTYLRTPLAPTYTANATSSSNGTFSTGGVTGLASSYLPTTTLEGYFNSTSN